MSVESERELFIALIGMLGIGFPTGLRSVKEACDGKTAASGDSMYRCRYRLSIPPVPAQHMPEAARSLRITNPQFCTNALVMALQVCRSSEGGRRWISGALNDLPIPPALTYSGGNLSTKAEFC